MTAEKPGKEKKKKKEEEKRQGKHPGLQRTLLARPSS
jgi:hypothetical protein